MGDGPLHPGTVPPRHPDLDAHHGRPPQHRLGTWPLCPWATEDTQQKRYTGIGQYTGHGGLYHTPEGATFAVHIEPPMAGAEVKAASLIEVIQRVLGASPPLDGS